MTSVELNVSLTNLPENNQETHSRESNDLTTTKTTAVTLKSKPNLNIETNNLKSPSSDNGCNSGDEDNLKTVRPKASPETTALTTKTTTVEEEKDEHSITIKNLNSSTSRSETQDLTSSTTPPITPTPASTLTKTKMATISTSTSAPTTTTTPITPTTPKSSISHENIDVHSTPSLNHEIINIDSKILTPTTSIDTNTNTNDRSLPKENSITSYITCEIGLENTMTSYSTYEIDHERTITPNTTTKTTTTTTTTTTTPCQITKENTITPKTLLLQEPHQSYSVPKEDTQKVLDSEHEIQKENTITTTPSVLPKSKEKNQITLNSAILDTTATVASTMATISSKFDQLVEKISNASLGNSNNNGSNSHGHSNNKKEEGSGTNESSHRSTPHNSSNNSNNSLPPKSSKPSKKSKSGGKKSNSLFSTLSRFIKGKAPSHSKESKKATKLNNSGKLGHSKGSSESMNEKGAKVKSSGRRHHNEIEEEDGEEDGKEEGEEEEEEEGEEGEEENEEQEEDNDDDDDEEKNSVIRKVKEEEEEEEDQGVTRTRDFKPWLDELKPTAYEVDAMSPSTLTSNLLSNNDEPSTPSSVAKDLSLTGRKNGPLKSKRSQSSLDTLNNSLSRNSGESAPSSITSTLNNRNGSQSSSHNSGHQATQESSSVLGHTTSPDYSLDQTKATTAYLSTMPNPMKLVGQTIDFNAHVSSRNFETMTPTKNNNKIVASTTTTAKPNHFISTSHSFQPQQQQQRRPSIKSHLPSQPSSFSPQQNTYNTNTNTNNSGLSNTVVHEQDKKYNIYSPIPPSAIALMSSATMSSTKSGHDELTELTEENSVFPSLDDSSLMNGRSNSTRRLQPNDLSKNRATPNKKYCQNCHCVLPEYASMEDSFSDDFDKSFIDSQNPIGLSSSYAKPSSLNHALLNSLTPKSSPPLSKSSSLNNLATQQPNTTTPSSTATTTTTTTTMNDPSSTLTSHSKQQQRQTITTTTTTTTATTSSPTSLSPRNTLNRHRNGQQPTSPTSIHSNGSSSSGSGSGSERHHQVSFPPSPLPTTASPSSFMATAVAVAPVNGYGHSSHTRIHPSPPSPPTYTNDYSHSRLVSPPSPPSTSSLAMANDTYHSQAAAHSLSSSLAYLNDHHYRFGQGRPSSSSMVSMNNNLMSNSEEEEDDEAAGMDIEANSSMNMNRSTNQFLGIGMGIGLHPHSLGPNGGHENEAEAMAYLCPCECHSVDRLDKKSQSMSKNMKLLNVKKANSGYHGHMSKSSFSTMSINSFQSRYSNYSYYSESVSKIYDKRSYCSATSSVSLASSLNPNHKNIRRKDFSKSYREIGRGATCVVKLVHKVNDPNLYFALKEYKISRIKQEMDERTFLKRLRNEYQIGSLLHHPNVIETIAFLMTKTHNHKRRKYFVVLEYCDGGDLFSTIQKGDLGREEINCNFRQLMDGVRYLHSLGIAHCDIKPENVLIKNISHLKIIDFGTSEIFKYPYTPDKIKNSKGIKGSKPYIAPEQFQRLEYDPRPTDIWSCAIVYIASLFNELPWRIATVDDFDFIRWKKERRNDLIRHIPNGPRQLITQMLNPDPEERITMEKIYENEWFASIKTCISGEVQCDDKKHIHVKFDQF